MLKECDKKFGVIDVGSNSVRLMLWQKGKTLYKKLSTTRLAQGMTSDGGIKQSQLNITAKAIIDFYNLAKKDGADIVYAFATAAVRNAKNKGDLISLVKKGCGLDLEVISGQQEANLAYVGALNGKTGGVIDIGGASTEIVFAKNGVKTYGKSVDIGAVKLTDMFNEDRERLREYLIQKISEYGQVPSGDFLCIGGTATSLSATILELDVYDATKTHGHVITLQTVMAWADKLFRLSLEERHKLIGLDSKRAEIIASGCEILSLIMQNKNINKITVSEKDNLEGYIISKLNGH